MSITTLPFTRSSEPLKLPAQVFSVHSALPKSAELWKIESGFVQVFTTLEDGTKIVFGIWGAEDVVGQAFSKNRPYFIECLTQVVATPVRLENLTNPTEIALKHLQQAEELMIIRSHKRIDTMLLKLLSWLAERFGTEVNQGRLIDLRLTHHNLSELLGATRVTVTRSLIQLEQQGFIQRLSLQRIVLQQTQCWHYDI